MEEIPDDTASPSAHSPAGDVIEKWRESCFSWLSWTPTIAINKEHDSRWQHPCNQVANWFLFFLFFKYLLIILNYLLCNILSCYTLIDCLTDQREYRVGESFDWSLFCMNYESFNPIFRSDGKQSVLIKDWINPQSNSFSVKQPFITKAHTPNWIVPSVRHSEQERTEREQERKLPP